MLLWTEAALKPRRTAVTNTWSSASRRASGEGGAAAAAEAAAAGGVSFQAPPPPPSMSRAGRRGLALDAWVVIMPAASARAAHRTSKLCASLAYTGAAPVMWPGAGSVVGTFGAASLARSLHPWHEPGCGGALGSEMCPQDLAPRVECAESTRNATKCGLHLIALPVRHVGWLRPLTQRSNPLSRKVVASVTSGLVEHQTNLHLLTRTHDSACSPSVFHLHTMLASHARVCPSLLCSQTHAVVMPCSELCSLKW